MLVIFVLFVLNLLSSHLEKIIISLVVEGTDARTPPKPSAHISSLRRKSLIPGETQLSSEFFSTFAYVVLPCGTLLQGFIIGVVKATSSRVTTRDFGSPFQK